MREALLIFRKDVRRHRLALVVFLMLIAVRTVIDIVLPHHPELVTAQIVLGAAFVMGAIGLAASAAAEECIVGDRQYWLTRPLPWNGILLAKLLFAAAFLAAPMCIEVAVARAANGVFSWDVVSSALSMAMLAAVVMGIASVTRNTVQLVLAAIGCVVLAAISTPLMEEWIGYESVNWGGATDLRTKADLLCMIAMIAIVLFRQYRWRHTGSSRAILAVGLLAPIGGLPGWHTAFSLLEKIDGPGASGNVSIAFDPSLGRPRPGGFTYSPGDDVVCVKLPISITGVPPHSMLVEERVRARIDAPGGRHLDTGWQALPGILAGQNPGLSPHYVIGAKTDYWLAVNIDRTFYTGARLNEVPVRLQATAAFSMLSESMTQVRLPIPSTGLRCGPEEFCSVAVRNGEVTIYSISASGQGSTRFPRGDFHVVQNWHSEMTTDAWTLDLFSAWSYTKSVSMSPTLTPEYVVPEFRRDAGRLERTIAIDAIRLDPYEVGRSFQRRSGGLFDGVRFVP